MNLLQLKQYIETIVLVHPNSQILSQLYTSLRNEGYRVLAFKRVKDANSELIKLYKYKIPIHKIIVPTNLKVYHTCTYQGFLNMMFPQWKVITTDKQPYREHIDLVKFKKELYYE